MERPEDYEARLEQLRINLQEPAAESSGCPCLPDQKAWLENLLEQCRYDVCEASYRGCIIKARPSDITLPDGLTVPNSRPYWLNLAKLYRKIRTHNMPRADEEGPYGF